MDTTILTDERLRSLGPLIAAAWDDGEPTDLVIAAVCMALLRATDADVSCTDALRRWLDTEHPPSPRELEELRAAA